MIKNIIITSIISIITGFLYGIVGTSAIALLQILLLIFNIVPNFRTAIGIIYLMIILPTTLLPTIQYGKNGYLMIYTGILITILFSIFSYIGSLYISIFSDKFILYLSGIVYIIIGIYILCQTLNDKLITNNKVKNIWS